MRVNALTVSFALCLTSFLGIAAQASAPLDCFRQANQLIDVTQAGAVDLCKGASNLAPAQCFRAVTMTSTSIDTDLAVKLCRYASSTEPAECFRRAMMEAHMKEESAVELCKSRLEVPGYFYPADSR